MVRTAATPGAFRDVDRAIRDIGKCERPGRDGANVCDHCLDALALILRTVPFIVVQLHQARTGLGGMDYSTAGGGKGGKKSQPLVIRPGVIAARDELRKVLRHAVLACLQADLTHSSPHVGRPHPGDVPAMADWLTWRVDAMATSPLTEDIPTEVATAVDMALHRLEPEPRLIELGDCPLGDCEQGVLTARRGAFWARCRACGSKVEAAPVRERLLAELDDRRCTAAEIAHLCGYLSSDQVTGTAEVIRKRINQWAARGEISPDVAGRYRFGAVYTRLLAHTARHQHAWSKWKPQAAQPDTDVVHLIRSCEYEGCDQTQTRTRRATTKRGA
ncbi:hypothetical protein [Nocardioides sp. R-C-SC26]|uniref:hypothetical protein n=1 Tax=Nocardioides sp. R-C-SC26 TaxID=2870414 RepID=UPI001E5E0256|nr:hypothetical protein [Nocardioides sp. R-C-SC26]